MPLVTDQGFEPIPPLHFILPNELEHATGVIALDVPNDTDVAQLASLLPRITCIRVAFPRFSDGRGFSLARQLRELGYSGKLIASGHLISDQYRHARACGFDACEIDDAIAQRQPEHHWIGQQPSQNYRDKLAGRAGKNTTQATHNIYAETVTSVEHYTDRLFSFRITRPDGFRFRAGEFVMIGLPNVQPDKPLFRAYSIASPTWYESLEFLSIKIPDGAFTQHLQNLQVGDTVLLRKKATGTLVLDALTPGKRLYMFSTGTGIAPFASLAREPDVLERFEQIILTQTCRLRAELTYGENLIAELYDQAHPISDWSPSDKLHFYTSVTRESHTRTGRIRTLIESGDLASALALPPLNPATDRIMICGSKSMLADLGDLCESQGFVQGSINEPGSYVIERAFAS